MKANRMVYIDVELIERLKDVNASALIEKLLREHYKNIKDDKDIENMTTEQAQQRLAELQLEKEFLDKVEALRNGGN